MSGAEVELKLVVSPDDLARVGRLRAKLGASPGRLTRIHQITTYFDTPERSLAAAGVVLRIRLAGKDRVQTVKGPGTRSGGLFHRPEWEMPISGDVPCLDLVGEYKIAALTEPGLAERLEPVFQTDITRRVCRIGGDGWAAEMALDSGHVIAQGRSLAIHEVELELIEGRPDHLFAIALAIAEHVPVGLTAWSKSERGHALSEGRGPVPVKAKPVMLKSKHKAAQAFLIIARACLHQLLANQPALLEAGDPEAVHQMRVALRRFRSALKVFAKVLPSAIPETLLGEMRWLLGKLGPARDGDVFLTEILAPVVEDHPGERSLATLQRFWQDTRDRDFAAARQAVGDPRTAILILRLGEWVESLTWTKGGVSATSFARRMLDKRLKRLKAAAGKSLLDLSADQRHQVRILGKQLRYGGDFLASLFPTERVAPYLATLSELQDQLGQLNDIAVAVPRLCAAHQSGRGAWAAGLVAGWHESRRPDLLIAAEAAWKRLRKMDPFWA